MNIFVFIAIAIGLSMDAFAVSICTGLSMKRATLKKAVIIGLYFGIFQAGMPLIGYAVASRFADIINAFSHWIAFGLLCFLGGKMILSSMKKEKVVVVADNTANAQVVSNRADFANNNDAASFETVASRQVVDEEEPSFGPKHMLPLAIATSIDALAVGVSLALLNDPIMPLVISTGIATFTLSAIGLKIGNLFGTRFKSKAELIGGIILVLIGANILIEHFIAA